MDYGTLIEFVGRVVDVAGVVVIAGGLVLVTATTVPMARTNDSTTVYTLYRRRIGKVILLGLELLVAADIIRTVAVSPTIESVVVLGLIVIVRTFLSFSLEVELYGRWPWQRAPNESGSETPTPAGEASGGPV